MENYTNLALKEGEIKGLQKALELARLQKEEKGDLDYLIKNIEELLSE